MAQSKQSLAGSALVDIDIRYILAPVLVPVLTYISEYNYIIAFIHIENYVKLRQLYDMFMVLVCIK